VKFVIYKPRKMKIFKYLLILFFVLLLSSCYAKRKTYSSLKGLMLLENTQLGRNKELYSKHNIKTLKSAKKKYRKQAKYRYR